jgi:hypothetical protein
MKSIDLISLFFNEKPTGTCWACPAWVIPCRGERLLFVLEDNLEPPDMSVWTLKFGTEYQEEFPDIKIAEISLADPRSLHRIKTILNRGKDAYKHEDKVS